MQQNYFFPYSWHVDEKEEEITSIRVYGLDKNNKNVCLRIDNFTPYIYMELPSHIKWTSSKAQMVSNKIDEIAGFQKPLKKILVYKKKLYGAHLDIDTGKRKQFPYLLCTFSSKNDIKSLGFKIRKPFNICGLGRVFLKMHESDADPILQLTCCRNIPTAGWIKFHGKLVTDFQKLTLCDYEYKVKWKHLFPDEKCNLVPRPLIMGFDIEVNSTNPTRMPKAEVPGDKVFQVSCVLARDGDSPDDYEKYILTLGDPDQKITGKDVKILTYTCESDLLLGYTEFIRSKNPNIIVGYNILGFDIPYMIARAKFGCNACCIGEFDKQGFHKTKHAKERIIKWSSSAYKNQEFEFLDAEGRVFVDLLPLIKRDFKFSNYKLKTISEYFVGETKDPLDAKGIFKCYRIGTQKNSKGGYDQKARKAMAIVSKYCVQDSALVVLLMEKLKTWVGLTEMAKTCRVPIFTLYTQGQQIKVYSQLYKYCMEKNIVVEKDAYKVKEDERYIGAKVFPPVPGQYENIIPFDFASLYPTTIIAYNIDYHTWVPDDSDIPDSMCHVMKWEDHQGCCHDPKIIRKKQLTEYIDDQLIRIKRAREERNKLKNPKAKKRAMAKINKMVEELKPYREERSEITKTLPKVVMCAKRRYRFLKEPRGVLPTVIQNLLDARKHTRKVDMIECKNEIKRLSALEGDHKKEIEVQKTLLDVLNKRQLSYKVSANSMYGAMGVRRGYLPFMPGAMCTTYMGRTNIEVVAKTIPEKYGGQLIYGDTDSNYIYFPHLKNAQETWDYAIEVADEVTKLFPPPIKLEFEEEIYAFFFILSKKRYMYRKCLRDGVVDQKIGKKGVLLARRDNSKFVRDVYEGVIGMIADNNSMDDILFYVTNQINMMCSGCKDYRDFVITKSVGDVGDLQAQAFIDEKGVKKAKVGDYTVPILSTDKDVREQQLYKKGATSVKEYYSLCLPAQVQLAEKMRRRGQRVDDGSRLEYIVSDPVNHTAKQYEKVESADYLAKHSDLVKVDFLYYLKALVNPMDQVLDVAFQNEKRYKKGFTMRQYKFRWKVRTKLHKELLDLFKPELKFN